MTIHHLPTLSLAVLLCTLGVACGGGSSSDTDSSGETGGDGDGDGDGDFPPELLNCPVAGPLPFTPQSDTFVDPANAQLVMDLPRFKDEASDVLGNPGGPYAYTRADVHMVIEL